MLALALTFLLAAAPLPQQPAPSAGGFAAVTWQDLALPGRRDFVFDADGVLYVTAGSTIQRYDTATGAFLPPFNVGGSLVGIDLSPDGATLAVADSTTQGDQNRVHLVDRVTGADTPVAFTRAFGETGTYMVAWGADGRLLVTSSYGGSGWVPLRRHDPQSGTTEQLGTVRQNTMLTASPERSRIALSEANISSGPVRVYEVEDGEIVAQTNTGWFQFEVAAGRSARYVLAPSYFGAFLYGRRAGQMVELDVLGQYASWGPVGAVFAPTRAVLLTADWGSQPGVKAYDLKTLQPIGTLDPYPFPWTGNGALGAGRMEISPDERWLAVSIANDGVRVYEL